MDSGESEKKSPSLAQDPYYPEDRSRKTATPSQEPASAEVQKKIIDAFEVFDHEHSKTVDSREIGTIIRSLGYCPSENDLQSVIKEMEDPKQVGFIHLDRFLPVMTRILMQQKFQQAPLEILKKAFSVLDSEAKGFLTPEELKKFFTQEGEKFSADEIEDMLNAAVDSKSGFASFVTIDCVHHDHLIYYRNFKLQQLCPLFCRRRRLIKMSEEFVSAELISGLGNLLKPKKEVKNKIICRPGTEDDVIKDDKNGDRNTDDMDTLKFDADDRQATSTWTGFSEEEFLREFANPEDQDDREVFDADPRKEAGAEVIQGEELDVEDISSLSGILFPPKKTLVIKVILPHEDNRTIDLTVKEDNLIMYSHQYKVWLHLPKKVQEESVKSEWNESKFELNVRLNVKVGIN